MPKKGNPTLGSTEAGVTPASGGTSEQGPSMSDAPAFDADKEAAAEHEEGLWGRLARLHGNLEAARIGLIAGGLEFAVGSAIGTAVTGVVCSLPGPLGGVVQTATDQGPPPIPEVTGNQWVDMLIDVDPGARIAGGFVISGRKLWDGDYYGSGHALAKPEAEVTMIAFGAMLVGGGSSTRGGSYGQLRSAGVSDAHHVIQDAAVRDLPGYSRSAAPAVELPGPSTRIGSPHYRATQVQRQAGGGTYAAERRIGYKALRRGGLSPEEARAYIEMADAYFQSIGVSPSTPTRIPMNR